MSAGRLLIGLGNDLRGDDAAGLLVARAAREHEHRGIEIVESGGEPVDLLDAWEGAEAAVVADAVTSGAEPGAVHRIDAAAGPLPPNPLELLSRASFAALLQKAQAEYDTILIDTPPVTEYSDAQCIAYRSGDVLLVSRKDQTRLADTEAAVRDLSDAAARIVGTLINAY